MTQSFLRRQPGRHPPINAALLSRIDAYFAGIGMGVNPWLLTHAKRRELAFLESLTDAELHRIGLSRDAIIGHVFRDLLRG